MLAVALPTDPHTALVERRPCARIGALPADREALVVRDTAVLLADQLVPVAAVLAEAHAREILVSTRLEHAAAAVVVAELPRQQTRHVPAREVRVRSQFRRPLREALEARVPLDALLVPRRVPGFRAPRVRLAEDEALWLGLRCCHRAQQEEVGVVLGRRERGKRRKRDSGGSRE